MDKWKISSAASKVVGKDCKVSDLLDELTQMPKNLGLNTWTMQYVSATVVSQRTNWSYPEYNLSVLLGFFGSGAKLRQSSSP